MSTHIIHPPIPEGGVVDDCTECRVKAESPVQTLDNDNLSMYLHRTLGWMRDDTECFPRSATEMKLMRQLESVIVNVERLNERGLLDIIIGERS